VKSIAIFTRTIATDGYPFNDDYHWNAYLDLLLALKERGAQAYFVTGNETYAGDGVFTQGYTVTSKVPVKDFTRVKDVQVDLVLEKGGFTGKGVQVLNPPFVHFIAASKLETYKHFAKYQPLSVICDTFAQVKAAFSAIDGDLIVVKEPEGNGGRPH
jgi:hypothetical protein